MEEKSDKTGADDATVAVATIPTPAEYSTIDYPAWDQAIVAAILSLETPKTRSQQFVTAHPTALASFRSLLSTSIFDLPLAPFQLHPTYLLRYLLAEWKDEEAKALRTDLGLIQSKSLERVQITQKWRAGVGECWSLWGYKNMDDLYENFTVAPEQEAEIQKWYFQGFYGTDVNGHPVHYELLPNSYKKPLMTLLIIRRLLNNEKTLRSRVLKYNPPLGTATAEQLSNPRLGVSWVLDARNLSIMASASMYKTMSELMSYSTSITAAHYPEQGYRALVISLGSVLISLYNIAMKVMPPQTQSTTKCFAGREVLEETISEGEVPLLFNKSSAEAGTVYGLIESESLKQKSDGDLGPWVRERQ